MKFNLQKFLKQSNTKENPLSEKEIENALLTNTTPFLVHDHPIMVGQEWLQPRQGLHSHSMLNKQIHEILGLGQPKKELFDFLVTGLPSAKNLVRCSCYEASSPYGEDRKIRECAVDIKGTPTPKIINEIKMRNRAIINAWSFIDEQNTKHNGFGEWNLLQEIKKMSSASFNLSKFLKQSNTKENLEGRKEDKDMIREESCWTGYEQIGMKEKGGKKVPNCVKKD